MRSQSTTDTRIATVIAGIAGWQNANWTRLDGGLSNTSWLLDADGRRAVLKIDAGPRGGLVNTRDREADVQSKAAGQGIAGRVLEVGKNYYLTEYVEGRVWTAADLKSGAGLGELAAALRRLHALPLTGRQFDAVAAAESYRATLCRADLTEADRRVAEIRELSRPGKRVCCHNDLVAGNIVSSDGVRFLDWEYAGDNDPLFDLATIVTHHDLSADKALCLLNAYFDGEGIALQAELERHGRIYSALCWLWQAACASR